MGRARRAPGAQSPERVTPSSLVPATYALDERPRCEAHGLLVGPNGRCLRCVHADRSLVERQTLRFVAYAIGAIVLVLFGARAFMSVRELAAEAAQHASSESRAGADGEAASAPGDGKLVLYTTSSCPYCRKAKSWLAAQNIDYEERDVESDSAARREMNHLGARGAPTFALDGKLVQAGYDPAGTRVLRALRERGQR